MGRIISVLMIAVEKLLTNLIDRCAPIVLVGFLVFTSLLISRPAGAAFSSGDVAVATAPAEAIGPDPFGGEVIVLGSDGSIKGSPIRPSLQFNPSGVGFDLSRRLLVSRRSLPANDPLETDVHESLLSRVGILPFGGVAFAFDATGNGYVADEFGQVIKFAPSGTQIRSFTLAHQGVNAIDLAADQCTMFYAYEPPENVPGIGRHDVCLDVALSNVPVTLPPSSLLLPELALRILPDGTILVTAGNRAFRVDAAGSILRQYSIPGVSRQWVALALDTTGTQFWVGLFFQPTGPLYRIDLNSGAVADGPFNFPQFGDIRSIAVAGEWRAATAPADSIPTLSTIMLLTLGIVLASVALRRLM